MDEFYCPTSASGRSLRCNFGGGSQPPPPKVPKQKPIKFPKMPKIHMPEFPEFPEIPPPAPPEPPQAPTEIVQAPPPPPPTATSAETSEAADQMRRDLSKRKGLRKTILAGETGGYQGRGRATILGNGVTAPESGGTPQA